MYKVSIARKDSNLQIQRLGTLSPSYKQHVFGSIAVVVSVFGTKD